MPTKQEKLDRVNAKIAQVTTRQANLVADNERRELIRQLDDKLRTLNLRKARIEAE